MGSENKQFDRAKVKINNQLSSLLELSVRRTQLSSSQLFEAVVIEEVN